MMKGHRQPNGERTRIKTKHRIKGVSIEHKKRLSTGGEKEVLKGGKGGGKKEKAFCFAGNTGISMERLRERGRS